MDHTCVNLPTNIMISSQTSYLGPDTGWLLCIQRLATEEDMEENENLEGVGDVVWGTVAEISYCPYWGEHLQSLALNPADGSVQVASYDYSGYAPRKL